MFELEAYSWKLIFDGHSSSKNNGRGTSGLHPRLNPPEANVADQPPEIWNQPLEANLYRFSLGHGVITAEFASGPLEVVSPPFFSGRKFKREHLAAERRFLLMLSDNDLRRCISFLFLYGHNKFLNKCCVRSQDFKNIYTRMGLTVAIWVNLFTV